MQTRDDKRDEGAARPGVGRSLRVALAALWVVATMALGSAAVAQSGDAGTVSIPLSSWQAMAGASERRLPGWGFAQASVTATANATQVDVTVSMRVQVLDEGRTLVPLLPAGVTGARVRIDGQDAPLLATSEGLAWVAPRAGTFQAQLSYTVIPEAEPSGWTAALPLPRLPSGTFSATLPSGVLRATAVPLRSPQTTRPSGGMQISGELPATSMVQLAWQREAAQGAGATRSTYRGTLRGETVAWTAEFTIHRPSDGVSVVPLLPSDVALVSMQVDGTEAPVAVVDGRFAAEVGGRGTHRVTVAFETPVLRDRGAPRVDLVIPEVPISRFELTLPGEKQVQTDAGAGVAIENVQGTTRAVLNVAMRSRVSLSWSEAIPEAEAVEVRASANLIHLVHAEERLLSVRVLAQWEIARGEVNSVELLAPAGIQFNTITSSLGTVADWRIAADEPRRLIVFFDRPMTGDVPLEIAFERTLGGPESGETIEVPLLEPVGVTRQRGLLALLSSDEVALEPVGETTATRVGENQLPAEVRDGIAMTVAHTFRYNEDVPRMQVRATEPPRVEARYDASVDTLVSLGDVTTRVAASIEVIVKQGRLMELELELPVDVNLLQLTAPSLRTQTTRTEDGVQRVRVEFTRELEGRFRLEAAWEKIQADATAAFEVPRVRVAGAEVEQGRIAVEALSAVEVQPSATDHLSSVDIAELPQQLVLRTTNPILMAFRYVQAEPAPRLALRVTRHEELSVQTATIEEAQYHTLYTEDGFAVTQARFMVRNSRRQFLRVRLPEGSEVWSAAVDGRAETPARATEGEGASGGPEVLIRIRSSDVAFPVELEFKSPAPRLGRFGRLRGELPVPDMVVTRTVWDVWLPDTRSWGEPDGDLQPVTIGGELHVDPTRQGVHLRFEKLYANQADGAVGFSIPYTSPEGQGLRAAVTLAGAIAVWTGALLLGLVRTRRTLGAATLAGGVVVLFASVVWAGQSWGEVAEALQWPLVPAVLAVAAWFGWLAWSRRRARRAEVASVSEAASKTEPAAPAGEVAPTPAARVADAEVVPAVGGGATAGGEAAPGAGADIGDDVSLWEDDDAPRSDGDREA